MPIFNNHILKMGAYKPPLEGRDPEEFLLLDFNERTLPVSPAIEEALVDYIRSGRLQMYPSYGDVVEKIASYSGVSPDQLMITNGSDQGIDLIFRAAAISGHEAIIPGPSFAMYTQCAAIENLKVISPQYDREEGFPTDAVLGAINEQTRIICIANPNNPCGTPVSKAKIERILQAAPNAAVMVDECYFEYMRETVVDLIGQYPNLLVTRTFSKTWGIPSLRMGYLMASAENIESLLKVRGPYDINQLAIVACQAALDSPEDMEVYTREVMEVSKPMLERFLASEGITFWPSSANYIWAFPEHPEKVEAALQKAGVLVRPKSDANGALGLRITIGTKSQTERVIEVLRDC
ncbi:MAG: histidinol-phosphate transaminase [Verrucomicrobiota bacterium]